MRNRNFLGVSLGTALALFCSSQVLAQALIEGWDKAKFGMSPEDLKSTYREEERYYRDMYYQRLYYIEKRYAGDARNLEYHKAVHGEYVEFWGEREEYWSREDGGFATPHTLFNPAPRFRILGVEDASLIFRFVESRLCNIEITLRTQLDPFLYDLVSSRIEEEARKNRQFKRKLVELRDALTKKYGNSFKAERKEGERKQRVVSGEITIPIEGEILSWTDVRGNMLTVESHLEQFHHQEKDYELLTRFTISYLDGNLTELWEAKQDEWRKEVAQWRKTGERLRTKGVDSF